MRDVGVSVVDVLKLDIEGAEFSVIEAWARDGFWPSNQVSQQCRGRLRDLVVLRCGFLDV